MVVAAARLRRARLEDGPALAGLTTQLGYPTTPAELGDRLAAVLGAPDDHAVLVAVDERDRPIGWVHVERVRSLERPATADLMGLVVAEGARSRGIGRSLVAAAEEQARSWGCGSLLVRSRVSRERAHRFYEREGYSLLKTSYVFEKAL